MTVWSVSSFNVRPYALFLCFIPYCFLLLPTPSSPLSSRRVSPLNLSSLPLPSCSCSCSCLFVLPGRPAGRPALWIAARLASTCLGSGSARPSLAFLSLSKERGREVRCRLRLPGCCGLCLLTCPVPVGMSLGQAADGGLRLKGDPRRDSRAAATT